jgi:hypothetical protein
LLPCCRLTPAVFRRWGNHLSNKFFLEKKFVVKHITNKHPEKVEEARKEVRRAKRGGRWLLLLVMHCCWGQQHHVRRSCSQPEPQPQQHPGAAC